MDYKFILHTRRNELVRKVQKHTSSLFMSGIQSIYEAVKRKNKVKKHLLKEFQKCLADISIWSQEILKNEHNRFVRGFPMFDKVIKSIFEIQTKLHGNKHIEIDCTDFMHQCYLNVARSVWKQPFLVYDVGVDKLVVQKNKLKLERVIVDGIRDTFEHFLPLEDDDIQFYEQEPIAEYIAPKQTIDTLDTLDTQYLPFNAFEKGDEEENPILFESNVNDKHNKTIKTVEYVDEHSEHSDYNDDIDDNNTDIESESYQESEENAEGNLEDEAEGVETEFEGSLAEENAEEDIEEETYDNFDRVETSVCDIESVADGMQNVIYEPNFDVHLPYTQQHDNINNKLTEKNDVKNIILYSQVQEMEPSLITSSENINNKLNEKNDVKDIIFSGQAKQNVQEMVPSAITPSENIKVVNYEEKSGKVKSLLSLKKKVKSSILNSHLHNPSFF